MSTGRTGKITMWLAVIVGGLLLFAGGALSPFTGAADTGPNLPAPAATEDASAALALIQATRDTADPTGYTRAGRIIQSVLDENPDDFQATLARAVLAGSMHDFAGQARIARDAIELNPSNATARGVLGDGLLELGDVDGAADAYQEMIDLRPDLAGYARIAHLLEAKGDMQGAFEAMHLSLESSASARDKAWALSQIGELHISERDLDAAEKAFEQGAAIDPGYFLPDVGRAHVAYARGDLDGAISIQTSVVDRYPAPAMVAELGDMLWAADRLEEADAAYARSADLLDAYLDVGVLPDVEMPVFFADGRRDPERALEMAKDLYRSRDGSATADALAWAYWSVGEFEMADRYAREALAEGGSSPEVHFHIGMIAVEQGDTARAGKHLKKSLSFGDYWGFRDPVIARRTIEKLNNG